MFNLLENTTTPTGGGDLLTSLFPILMLVVMFVAMYFLTIRPQKKAEKEANDMRNNLQVGDEVTTIGGIIGRIVSIKDETCVIETTKNGTKIRFLKSAIRNVDVKAEDAQ
jgi:preprotein translocase subunit YajC